MNTNAINWFEIPVKDYQRAKKFYETVFNYEMPEMTVGNATLGILPHDQEGGGVGGAIIKDDDYVPSDKGVRIYFEAAEPIEILLDRVSSGGGKVILKKTIISEDIGYFAQFQDTEGNVLAFHSLT